MRGWNGPETQVLIWCLTGSGQPAAGGGSLFVMDDALYDDGSLALFDEEWLPARVTFHRFGGGALRTRPSVTEKRSEQTTSARHGGEAEDACQA
jgi:hypothetical protein